MTPSPLHFPPTELIDLFGRGYHFPDPREREAAKLAVVEAVRREEVGEPADVEREAKQ